MSFSEVSFVPEIDNANTKVNTVYFPRRPHIFSFFSIIDLHFKLSSKAQL